MDEGVKNVYYADKDGDGYGDQNDKTETCAGTPPAGYVTDNTDCNVYQSEINPGAGEISGNGKDDNCNGVVDEVNVGLQPNHNYELRILPVPTTLLAGKLVIAAVDENTGQLNSSFTFAALPGAGSNLLLDNGITADPTGTTFIHQGKSYPISGVTGFGSGIAGDGYGAIIRFTTGPDGTTFTGTTGTSEDMHFDTFYDTAGGDFATEYDPNGCAFSAELDYQGNGCRPMGSFYGTIGSIGSMTFVPDGRTGATENFPWFIGGRWNVDKRTGEYGVFTTDFSSNDSGTVHGSRITPNGDGTFSVTLVYAGVIGSDWAGFAGVPYIEVWKGVVVDAGASNTNLVDHDVDGFSVAVGDCNDVNPAVNPGAQESIYNGTDEDCSAQITLNANKANKTNTIDPTRDDDLDGDGYPAETDCNDNDKNVNPAAMEINDGIDNNCNGVIDEAWKDLPDGSYVFVVDPDEEHINSGEDTKLKTYFWMGGKWKAIAGSNNLPSMVYPQDVGCDSNGDNCLKKAGDLLKPAGLIYFTNSSGSISLTGQTKKPDASGQMSYPGDYRIAKFTSPGGEYTSYLETMENSGEYSGQSSSTPGQLELDLNTAMADTQYAGTKIPFPYAPLGTESYDNTSETHKGIRAQYLGVSTKDLNGDGVANDDFWSVTLAAAGNVPNSVPGFAGAPFGHVLNGWIIYLGSSKNHVPTADAGADMIVQVESGGATVHLDGAQSSDPDTGAGDAVEEYAWRLIKKPLGSRVVVLNPTASSLDIALDRIGLYTFGLAVKDSKGAASSEAIVSVIALAGGSYCIGETCTECMDSDQDGMCDSDESIGTEFFPDADLDGTLDGEDLRNADNNVDAMTLVDTDGDGITDGLDPFPNDAASYFSEDNTQAYVQGADGVQTMIQVGNTNGMNKNGVVTELTKQAQLTYAKVLDPSDPKLTGVDLPDGAMVLEYNIEYNLTTFEPGATVTVTIQIPNGITNPSVYKIVDGKLQQMDADVDVSGSGTVVFTVTDGHTGDEDGLENGIIVDPVVIGQSGTGGDTSVSGGGGGGGGGGGCAISGYSNTMDAAVFLLPLFVLYSLRLARKRVK